MNEKRFAGKTALVTGAGSGIGQAVARQLAAEGATVVCADVDVEGLTTTAKMIRQDAHLCITVQADVTEQADVDRLMASLPDGHVDLLANVAGVMDHFLPVTELDDATWERVLAVNLTGPMRLCRAVLPLMRTQRHGAIVNVSSIGGLSGSVAGTAYVASKHGLIGLTRSLACLYADDGIRVNAVCPGGVETNIGATAAPEVGWAYERLAKAFARAGRLAQPSEVSALICWLGSAEAGNVNGSIMTCDGGWTA